MAWHPGSRRSRERTREQFMKLFLSTDFEGTSGIVAWEQIIEGQAEYSQGRLLLTNEVNAVIAGAREAGASEFVVNDAHSFMRNLHPQDLLGDATLITGRHKPLYMMEGLDSSFDGVLFVSYHGSIGAERAILSHTYNPRAIWEARLNSEIVGDRGSTPWLPPTTVYPLFLSAATRLPRVRPRRLRPRLRKSWSKSHWVVLPPPTCIQTSRADSCARGPAAPCAISQACAHLSLNSRFRLRLPSWSPIW